MVQRFQTFVRRLVGEKPESHYFRRVLSAKVAVGPRVFSLEQGRPLALGRLPTNDVVIESSSASGHHARIKLEAGRVWVIDLGSTNGTLLNGKPIPPREWMPVRTTDQLAVADQGVTLDLELEAPLAPPVGASEAGSLLEISEDRTTRPLLRRRPESFLRRQESASVRRAKEMRRLVGGVVVLSLVSLLMARACAGFTRVVVPGKTLSKWRVRGMIQLSGKGEVAELVLTLQGVPEKRRYTYTTDAKGRYGFDVDISDDSSPPPKKLTIELFRNGSIIDAEKDLILPPPSKTLEVAPLGVIKNAK